jgi:copper resistance protein C
MISTTAKMKQKTSALLMLASALLFVPLAAAHAFLERAIPGAGTAVHQSPAQLKLWFSERLEPAFSNVDVQDANHKRVDKGDSQVAGDDGKLLQTSLPPLAPGKYHVTWRVLSVDTHVAKGEFDFDIAP